MKHSVSHIQREITPLSQGDCLLVFDRMKSNFDFPVHFHPEYELNFIFNACEAQRVIGDHTAYISQYELVLTGPNVYHGWNNGRCQSEQIHEITIQFHRDLFHESLLSRNMMNPIKELLNNASRGILFADSTIQQVAPRLKQLSRHSGIEAFMELITVLHLLSISENQKMLCQQPVCIPDSFNSDRIKKVYQYIAQNYQEKMKVEQVAKTLNMTETTLSRLVKQRTGKSFIDFLNDYRIGFATRWLTETNQSIAEIAFRCGFYNISNFNRIFKKNRGCTPGAYRDNFSGIKKVS